MTRRPPPSSSPGRRGPARDRLAPRRPGQAQARLQGHADAPRRQVARPRRRPPPAARHHPRHAQHPGRARQGPRPTRSSSSTARTSRTGDRGNGAGGLEGRGRRPRHRRGQGGARHRATSSATCQFHVEWSAPTPPKGRDQGRGNSGVIIFGRYEIQVLDCFENLTYPDGQTAAIYGQYPAAGQRLPPAGPVADLRHHVHGPPVQARRLARVAGVRDRAAQRRARPQPHGLDRPDDLPGHPAKYEAHEPTGPIVLQDHGNPVTYRNIWVRPIKGYDEP